MDENQFFILLPNRLAGEKILHSSLTDKRWLPTCVFWDAANLFGVLLGVLEGDFLNETVGFVTTNLTFCCCFVFDSPLETKESNRYLD